jgi:hypothetical protein
MSTDLTFAIGRFPQAIRFVVWPHLLESLSLDATSLFANLISGVYLGSVVVAMLSLFFLVSTPVYEFRLRP